MAQQVIVNLEAVPGVAMPLWGRRIIAAVHSDRGSVAVSFLLSLPIFLVIIGIIVQWVLLVNAQLMVDRAAQIAARSAVTALPDQPQTDAIQRAAAMALVPLSPQAQSGASQEATQMQDALTTCGVNVPTGFANRYTYAQDAGQVSWNPSNIDYRATHGQQFSLTIHYQFDLTIPFVMSIIAPQETTIDGVKGHFFTISSTVTMESSHGRRAVTDENGWPQDE